MRFDALLFSPEVVWCAFAMFAQNAFLRTNQRSVYWKAMQVRVHFSLTRRTRCLDCLYQTINAQNFIISADRHNAQVCEGVQKKVKIWNSIWIHVWSKILESITNVIPDKCVLFDHLPEASSTVASIYLHLLKQILLCETEESCSSSTILPLTWLSIQ